MHCCREIEALVFFLANLMIVRQGMFFNYEKRRHARKCVIWPILGTSFSTNRHIYIYIYIYIYRLTDSGVKEPTFLSSFMRVRLLLRTWEGDIAKTAPSAS